ncbi:MAG: adenosylcobinamide-phosphate synthase CbiB [Chloroflexota bacterium]
MEVGLVLVLAFVADVALGDPPDRLHPVAGMGRVIAFLEKGGMRGSPRWQFFYGAGIVLVTVALFAVPTFYLLAYLRGESMVIYVIVAAVLLKMSFAARGLWRAAERVRRLLLEERRAEVPGELRALVSRDTAALPDHLMVSAAVESVAEGLCDSIVAPLGYFLLGGVPAAIGYRAVNTMDAMIGYHGKYEYLGKAASRLDDVLNFIPARLAALLLVIAAFLAGADGKAAWRTAFREHSRTESPNAGWPMAAMAGALGVQLEKAGHYRLGIPGKALEPATITDAVRLMRVAALLWGAGCLAIGGIYFAVTT